MQQLSEYFKGLASQGQLTNDKLIDEFRHIIHDIQPNDEECMKNIVVNVLSTAYFEFVDTLIQTEFLKVLNEVYPLAKMNTLLEIHVAPLQRVHTMHQHEYGQPEQVAHRLMWCSNKHMMPYGGRISPLMLAVTQCCTHLMNAIVDYGISFTCTVKEENVIIDIISEHSVRGNVETALQLFHIATHRAGIPVSHANIMYAVEKNQLKLVEAMLAKKTPKRPSAKHSTSVLLMNALQSSRCEAVVLAVLEHVKNPTSIAFITAAKAGYTRVVQRMLSRGLTWGPEWHSTALKHACRNGNPDIVRAILHNSNLTSLDLYDALETCELYDRKRARDEVVRMFKVRRIVRKWRARALQCILGATHQCADLPNDVLNTIACMVTFST